MAATENLTLPSGAEDKTVEEHEEPSDEDHMGDMCRVCRMGSTPDRTLYYPCHCTGSIKYIHQECLTQWLKYSKKEYCELCNFKYNFKPIYHPDMPKRLPVRDLASGLMRSVLRALTTWLHYTLVAVAWLGIVPLSAFRIYRCLFTGSLTSLLTLPLDVLSTEHMLRDCLCGTIVVGVTFCTFLSLIWIRDQITNGGLPDWMDGPPPFIIAPPAPEPPPSAETEEEGDQEQVANEPSPSLDTPGSAELGTVSSGSSWPLLSPQDEVPSTSGSTSDTEGVHSSPPSSVGGSREDECPEGRGEDPGESLAHQEPPGEPVLEGQLQPAAAAGANGLENWQPFEWNQAGEELTWERLLGVDGSFVFLEHVFWVISLNTLFILLFAFSPYHIGQMVVSIFRLTAWVQATRFETLTAVLIGYLTAGFSLFLLYFGVRALKWKRTTHIVGMSYLMVKVFLLIFLDIGLFPLVCGWWLDICSLKLFSATLEERIQTFYMSPATSTFIHWLIGMVYVFYVASFILLLREILRPGLLWFLRNINDPDFNPIQEVAFSAMVMLVVRFPVQILDKRIPYVLPYNISISSETPLGELSLELLLLQIILPALLEQSQARQVLKTLTTSWCKFVGHLLGLTDYLLPKEHTELASLRRPPRLRTQGNAEGQEMEGDEENFASGELTPDDKPSTSTGSPQPPQLNKITAQDFLSQERNNEGADRRAGGGDNNPRVPDELGGAGDLRVEHRALFSSSVGTTNFQPYERPTYFAIRVLALVLVFGLSLVICSLICLTVPVTLGRLSIGLIMSNTTVHEFYTLTWGTYLTWILVRCGVAVIQWCSNGWEAFLNSAKTWGTIVGPVYREIILPLLSVFGLAKAIPYIVAFGILPLLGHDEQICASFHRHVYPITVVIVMFVVLLVWHLKKLRDLLTHIRDDKYLVGQKLLNFERKVDEETSENKSTTTENANT